MRSKMVSVVLAVAGCLAGAAVAGDWVPPFVAPLSYLKVDLDRETKALALKTVTQLGFRKTIATLTIAEGETPLAVKDFKVDDAKLTITTAKGAVEATFAGPRSLIFRATSPALSMKVDFANPPDWFYSMIELPSKIGRPVACVHKSTGNYIVDVRRGERRVDARKLAGGAEVSAVTAKPRGAEPFEFALREGVLNWEDDMPTGTFEQYLEIARQDYRECQRRAAKAYHRENVPAKNNATFAAAIKLLHDLQVEPRGHLKRRGMLMSKNWMLQVWSWDNIFNAIAVAPYDFDLAFEQLQAIFDHQASDGSIPDSVSDGTRLYSFVKPPILGWATKWLFKCPGWTRERKEQLYTWMARQTDWWLNCRDRDHNGLCEYDHGNDSGWDNASAFLMLPPIETTDLQTLLILQMDALAKLGAELGKDGEVQKWKARSDALLKTMLEVLFDAEGRPLARRVLTGETQTPDSLLLRYPLLLGERLPAKIRQRLIAEVKSSKFLTEWGLATEPPKSPHYVADGYWLGPIWAPSTMVMFDALKTCGETQAAADLAARYRRLIQHSGFSENFNAVTGEPLRDRAYSWAAAVYLMLLDE